MDEITRIIPVHFSTARDSQCPTLPVRLGCMMTISRRKFFTLFTAWLSAPCPALPRASSAEPWSLGPAWLEKWKRAPRIPLLESGDPVLQPLISAVENKSVLVFAYHGGRNPGAMRRTSPGLVFQCGEFPGTYLAAYCHTRQAERIFRADLIEPC